MFSTGVRLNYSASAAALVLSGGDIIGNPAFDNGPPPFDTISTDVDTTIATAGFTQNIFANPVVYGVPTLNGYQLLLGTFTFTAGRRPAHSMLRSRDSISVRTWSPGQVPRWTARSATPSSQLTWESVPEPETLGTLATGMLLCLGYRWRRCRSAA